MLPIVPLTEPCSAEVALTPRSRLVRLWPLLLLLLSACPPVQVHYPAAETPLLETVLDVDGKQLVPFDASGDYYRTSTAALGRVVLRLRAPWPSDLMVSVDGAALPAVTDTAAHPELDASGFYRVDGPDPVSASDPLFFWRVLAVLPQAKRAISSPLQIAVTDVSRDASLTGTARTSVPLAVVLRPFDATRAARKPSEIFFSGDNQKHPLDAVIARDVVVAGWIVRPLDRGGNADGSTEDVHFDIWLDNDFIVRNYVGVHRLDAAIVPGRPYTAWDNVWHPAQQFPLTGGAAVTGTTFLFPGLPFLNAEQNAWHVSKRQGPPPGWLMDIDPAHADDAYPQILTLPASLGQPQPFAEGDYVVLVGVLVEDSAHLHFPNGQPQNLGDWTHKCWDEKIKGNGGWLEIHPFDAIRKLRPPAVRKHIQLVQLCGSSDPSSPLPFGMNAFLTPLDATPPTANSVLRYAESVDSRFTDASTVSRHTVEIAACEPAKLHVDLAIVPQGRFFAAYEMWWEEGSSPRPPATPCAAPRAGEPPPTDPPICLKKPYLPQCDPIVR